jgi:hypothetical protein
MAMTAQVDRAGSRRTATVSRIGNMPSALARYEDPLDADRADDVAVLATRRSLCRVALIASEAGARFQRESAACEPMAWMLAPRKLFGGAAAIEACLDRENFSRALILHGLGFGTDADPEEIDKLLEVDGDGDGDDQDDGEGGAPAARSMPAKQSRRRPVAIRSGSMSKLRIMSDRGDGPAGTFTTADRRRLYSATVVYQASGLDLVAFHASFAYGFDEMFERLYYRFGGEVTAVAQVRVGFDAGHPLLPAMMVDMLRDAEGWPDDGRSIDLDVNFERRVQI